MLLTIFKRSLLQILFHIIPVFAVGSLTERLANFFYYFLAPKINFMQGGYNVFSLVATSIINSCFNFPVMAQKKSQKLCSFIRCSVVDTEPNAVLIFKSME